MFEAGGVLMQCLCLWLPKSMINNSSTTKWDAQPESSEMNFVPTDFEQELFGFDFFSLGCLFVSH